MSDYIPYKDCIGLKFVARPDVTFTSREVLVPTDPMPGVIPYTEPKRPATTQLVRVGPDQPIKTLAAYIKVAKPGTEVQIRCGSRHEYGGWTPPAGTILTSYGDGPPPILVCQYDGTFSSTCIAANNDDTWVEGIRVERHPASTGNVLGFAVKGSRVVFKNCSTGPGVWRGINLAEGLTAKQATDIWLLDNVIDFAVDYGLSCWLSAPAGGCRRVYARNNFIAGTTGGNHTTRFYGISDARFEGNTYGPQGIWQKSIFNVRQAKNVAWIGETFTGLPLSKGGSGAGMGPQSTEPNYRVTDCWLKDCVFKNLSGFALYPGLENLNIDGGEMHYVKSGLGVNTANYGAVWQLPSGTIRNLKIFGSPAFIKGDTSKLNFKNLGNTLDAAAVK